MVLVLGNFPLVSVLKKNMWTSNSHQFGRKVRLQCHIFWKFGRKGIKHPSSSSSLVFFWEDFQKCFSNCFKRICAWCLLENYRAVEDSIPSLFTYPGFGSGISEIGSRRRSQKNVEGDWRACSSFKNMVVVFGCFWPFVKANSKYISTFKGTCSTVPAMHFAWMDAFFVGLGIMAAYCHLHADGWDCSVVPCSRGIGPAAQHVQIRDQWRS